MNPVERLMRRRNVTEFIVQDKVEVALVRKTKVRTPAMGWRWETQPPLPPQVVRIVPAKRRYGDVHVNTEAGALDNWPYLMLGDPDMDVQEKDTFTVNGMVFEVQSIEYDREERTVAAITYYGGDDNA